MSECARAYLGLCDWDYLLCAYMLGAGIAQQHNLRTVVSDALGIDVHSDVCVCVCVCVQILSLD